MWWRKRLTYYSKKDQLKPSKANKEHNMLLCIARDIQARICNKPRQNALEANSSICVPTPRGCGSDVRAIERDAYVAVGCSEEQYRDLYDGERSGRPSPTETNKTETIIYEKNDFDTKAASNDEMEGETTQDDKDKCDQSGLRPDTPSSHASSGFGTLTTSESEAVEIFSRPSTVSSVDDDDDVDDESSCDSASGASTRPATPKNTEIWYQGRDILDLYTNLTYQWNFQMAVLPPHNLASHFANRSVYHRLGPFGNLDELAIEPCTHCKFDYVLPKY